MRDDRYLALLVGLHQHDKKHNRLGALCQHYVGIYTIGVYFKMYHFHTSDQRKVSAYISHIALAQEC